MGSKDLTATIKDVLDDADSKAAASAALQATADAAKAAKEASDTELSDADWAELARYLTWMGAAYIPDGIDPKYGRLGWDALVIKFGVRREKLDTLMDKINKEKAKRAAKA